MGLSIAFLFFISVFVISPVYAEKPGNGLSEQDISQLEKKIFVYRSKPPVIAPVKPDWAGSPGGPDGDDDSSDEYELLDKFAKWRDPNLPITYDINTNNSGLTKEQVGAEIQGGAEVWDSETDKELFSDSYDFDTNADWDGDAPDGNNELVFGNYPEYGVIAVTVIWGYFSGPPQN